MDRTEEDEIEYLDYVKPNRRRNRKRRQQKRESQKEQEQSRLTQGNCINGQEIKVAKIQVVPQRQVDLSFQPDTTINNYQHQLSFLQEQHTSYDRNDKKKQRSQVGQVKSNNCKVQTKGKDKNESQIDKSSDRIKVVANKGNSQEHVILKQTQRNLLAAQYNNVYITLSQQQFVQVRSDILFIPFQTSHFEFYPGSMLKQKLTSERNKIEKASIELGGIYIKNNHEVQNHRFLVFLKTDLKELWKHLVYALNAIVAKIKKDHLQVSTFTFFIEDEGISASEMLKGISASSLKKLEKQLKFQMVTTKRGMFTREASAFEEFALKYPEGTNGYSKGF